MGLAGKSAAMAGTRTTSRMGVPSM
uniref:Uncharacterized protein n=1 Tax=Arundo donax TaxID=35708 RepID=A0A0A9AWW0_ARUDO